MLITNKADFQEPIGTLEILGSHAKVIHVPLQVSQIKQIWKTKISTEVLITKQHMNAVVKKIINVMEYIVAASSHLDKYALWDSAVPNVSK